MLATIDDEGNMTYECLCGGMKETCVTFVQLVDPTTAALPACGCGKRMFVRISWSDEELAAPNMQGHPAIELHGKLAQLLAARL